MKTIHYHIVAGVMLAATASAMLAGSASADDVGRVRLTDDPAQTNAVEAGGEVVIRGSSDIRNRNARTVASLRRLFSGSDADVRSSAPVRQVGHHQLIPVGACCPADACCPPTCAAPDECCAPSSCAPDCCAPNDCCAPSDCCAPNNCCAPAGCCPPDCGCPAGECDCAPGCACPADSCCCPDTCDCAPGDCACPADNCCCPDGCDSCDGCTTAGRIRISDLFGGGNSDACGDGYGNGNGRRGGLRERRHARTCRHGYSKGNCPICGSRSLANRHCVSHFLCGQAAAHRARNRLASANLNEYLHCKFGCLIHDGHGGVGSPMFGHYSVVYPVDAGYFDSRDGGVYAAQGYGGAVSVPLAPTVGHTWNYGWGIPSSRLTPVSNTAAP